MPGQGRAAYPYTDFRPLAGKSWRMLSVKGQMRSGLKRMLNGLHIHKTLRIYCPEKTYTLYKGASSWAITPELARLIVKTWDDNERLVTYFRTSYHPVETFVQPCVVQLQPPCPHRNGLLPRKRRMEPVCQL